MTPRLDTLAYLALGAGVAGTWGLMALAEPRDGDLPAVVRYLWAAAPFAVVALATRFLASTPARRLVALAGGVAIASAGVAAMYWGLVIHPAPNPAGDVLVLPAYLLVAAVCVLLVLAVMALRPARRR